VPGQSPAAGTEALGHRWPVARTEDRSVCLPIPHWPRPSRKWPELRAEIEHLSVSRTRHQSAPWWGWARRRRRSPTGGPIGSPAAHLKLHHPFFFRGKDGVTTV